MPKVCRRDSGHHTGDVSPCPGRAPKNRETGVPKARITILQNGETPGSIVELSGRVGSVLARASSPSAVLLRDTPWRVEEKIRRQLT